MRALEKVLSTTLHKIPAIFSFFEFMTRYALTLSGIEKSFICGEQRVLAVKQASLSIARGEVVALIGPSGSGKTTLMQIAGLLESADSGTIEIDGKNFSNSRDSDRTNARKNYVGFIYQFHHLMAEFSVLENVSLPLLVRGIDRKLANEQARKILELVGLSERLHHQPSEFSGGEQQRVSVARAIVANPALVLADEPTGNLDSTNALKVFNLLMSLAKSNNSGCLIVTHNTELAKQADRTLTIKDGVVNDDESRNKT